MRDWIYNGPLYLLGNYYMIPERNLIVASELSNEQQLLWVRIITDMMEEGPRLLLRLKTFRQAIIGYPEPLIWYSKMRTEMEMWMLELYNRLMEIMDTNSMVDETDTIVQTCRKRTTKIRRGVLWRMDLEGSTVNGINITETMLS
ncbi:hypothetical protein DPMN_027990 [Dreissena polymorpha]|uniref:Uncharacterized protein n=1 Tax=Dreissena polymorpha TaxID=45954 RepID=A0A9D4LWD1_DREPO|nr:hypothetical protein DPMN_027990 [Dreissena polymorpha]